MGTYVILGFQQIPPANRQPPESMTSARWAHTIYKWTKWPCKWVTVFFSLLIGVITPVITGRGSTLFLTKRSGSESSPGIHPAQPGVCCQALPPDIDLDPLEEVRSGPGQRGCHRDVRVEKNKMLWCLKEISVWRYKSFLFPEHFKKNTSWIA